MSNYSPKGQRRGAVLVGVLACLLVGSVLTAVTVQSALRGRREARLERQLLQTELLCEAGVMRAVKNLQSTAEYRGETWKPSLDELGWRDAEVVIEISNSAATTADQSKTSDTTTEASSATDDQSALSVRVVARLDSTTDNDGPMQRSHTFTIQINQAKSVDTSTENK